MEKIMKIVTIEAYTKDEAIQLAGLKLEVKKDATISWCKTIEEDAYAADLKLFTKEYAEKKDKSVSGNGYIIVLEQGIADSREKPYKVINNVTDGPRKWKISYEGFTDVSPEQAGNLVFVKNTKGEAKKAAKDYVAEHKKDVEIKVSKQVVKGQDLAMSVKYTPSINTKKGKYIIFGYEN